VVTRASFLGPTMWAWLRAVFHFVPLLLPMLVIQGFTLALLWPFVLARPYAFLTGAILIVAFICTVILLNLLWTIWSNRKNPPPVHINDE